MREKSKEENVKYDYYEIKTKNVELENSVAKLLLENERLCNEINHVKHVFKEQFDLIKKTHVHTKEQSDSLIDKLSLKSAENEDLKAQIQDKVFVITLLQNKEAHLEYLKYTQEQADILQGIVKQAKAEQPLDKVLDFAYKHAQQIHELLVYVRDTCPNAINLSAKKVVVTPKNKEKKVRFTKPLTSSSNIKQVESSNTSDSNIPVLSSTGLKCSSSKYGSKSTDNKRNDSISQTPSRNIKNKVEAQPRKVNKKNYVDKLIHDVDVKHSQLNANSEPICATCKKSLFDGVHDMCFLDFVKNVNSHCKSTKKHKKENIWRPMGHVFTKVGLKWKPTGRTFTIVGNLCPLTRITSANVVLPKKTTSYSVETQKPELKVYSRKPKIVKNVCSSKKSKIVESKNANHSKPNHTWGSNATDIPSSSSLVMTGIVRFENDNIARIMGYGDYQLGNVTISRKNTCFIHNLEGVDLFSESRDINLYTISLDDMLKTSSICLLSKASNTKSWLWHHRSSHLNFGKSKKSSHQPKAEDTNQEKLYLLHMDLCGPMRVASIYRKRYILTLRKFYENVGIMHQKSVARTPQQNGVVERRNQTLVEAARTVLIFSKALLFLWDEAINTACYTQNRSIICHRYNKTPYELMQDKKPDLSFFHVFGALCGHKESIQNLKPKGYMEKILETIHVTFDELTTMASEQFSLDRASFYDPATSIQEATTLRAVVLADSPVSTSIDQDAPSSKSTPQGSSSNMRQTHTPFEHLGKWTKDHPIANVIDEPKNFKQAMTEPSWIDAMQEEIHEFERLQDDKFGGVLKNKARLVAQGFRQEEGIAFEESFTLVYISQPEGFVDQDNPSHVYKLKKALYGLKQAPRAWYDMLSSFLISQHFSKGVVDPTLFTRQAGNDLLLSAYVLAYADADHAGCYDTRHSTSGSAQFLGDKLLIGYCFQFDKIPLYCDNKSVIALCCNNVQHSRAKHIDVCYHFIKDQVENGIVELYFVQTKYQLADICTKPLPRERFNFLIEKLGMRSMSPEMLKYLAEETKQSGRSQGRRSYGDNGRSNVPTNESSSQALVAQDGLGGYDWSNDFEVEPVNYALMAISSSSSSSSSDSEVQQCSKCLESFKCLQKNYDTEREKHNKAKLEIRGYEIALESLESRIIGHEKNELAWGEKYEFQNYELKCREIKINNLNLELEKAVKERDELKDKIAKWEESTKNLEEILKSQMSARDKTGLGYSTQLNELSSNHETDSENSLSIFDGRSSDDEHIPENDRFSKNGYKAVPPPITGNFLTPRADISFAGLDEYAIRNKIIESQTTELNTKTSETAGKTNDANTEKPKSVSESVVSNPKINRDSVIIEDWTSDDEEEVSGVQKVRPENQTVKTRDDKSGQNSHKQGVGFRKVKACFVCRSTEHLIKDCNFHDKKSQESNLKNVVNTGKRESKPVWDNTKRVNHPNFSKYPHLSETFVPAGVSTRTGLHRPSINTARSVCTARPSINTARPVSTVRPSISTARPSVSIARPSVSTTRPVYATRPTYPRVQNMTAAGTRAAVNTGKGKLNTDLKRSKWVWRPKGTYLDHVSKDSGSFMLKKGNLEILLQDHAVVDSGCSSHMTGNKAYLSDYEDFNGGFVAFGSDPKGG
ncbi:retrovirus-related pol polyprotein from transposon TNT 1-94 [Tanacetum coccineum]